MAISLQLLLLFGFLAILPFSLLLLAVTAALYFGREKHPRQDPYCSHKFSILVPAHNEEAVIGATVDSLLALDYPQEMFTVYVIADNCVDRTAAIAQNLGATVIERTDATKKSKGYALEYTLERLGAYDGTAEDKHAFVVIDADSTADRSLLRRCNDYHTAGFDWLQVYYTSSNPEQSDYTKMLTYAFALFNGCWQLGLSLLGLSASFRGCGMSFSKKGLQRHPFNVYGLTEDLEFSWRLRSVGETVAFLSHVRVYGEMVQEQGAAAQSQRLRWEQGRAELKKAYGGKIWAAKQLPLLSRLVYLADLYMLPLTKYMAALLGLAIAAVGYALLAKGSYFWLGYAFICLFIFGLYSISPLFKLNIPIGYLAIVLKLPKYMLWKLILFFKRDEKAWVRTKRNSEN